MTGMHRFGKMTVFHTMILALILALFASPTWAQDDQSDDDKALETEETDEDSVELDRVIVTGSLIKREDFTSTSPMQIIDAETMLRAGQLTAADMLQSSTVAAGTVQQQNQFGGFINAGGVGVETLDIRGLGTARTLVLLNGRRPGGSGTRGQVNALDLTAIPDIAVERFEIVLDGSSSIYGSDAIAGVANIITKRSVEDTQISATADVPVDSGGESYRVGLLTGANFDKGSLMFSAQWTKQEALRTGDRDFLACSEDRVTDAAGNRIDRENRSAIAGTPGESCYNMWFDSVIDALTGQRWITSPDGVFEGPVPGRRVRQNNRFDQDPLGVAYYETVRYGEFLDSQTAINETERINIYATADFTFGNIDWDADVLYSNRQTKREGWRQFFPLIGGAGSAALIGIFDYANDPSYSPVDPAISPVDYQLTQPIYPYPSNSSVDVDYFYASTGLSGVLPTDSYWSWQVYAAYSRSDGEYVGNSIVASRSGDVRFDDNPPTYDPFDAALLNGTDIDRLVSFVGANTIGNTVYEQWQATAIISGDLFEMPAGTVGTALGVEYRDFSIDDKPDALSKGGDLWGQSSATATKGSNNVAEIFGEIEVPLLAGITGIESLTVNGSARYFDYDSGGSDAVWKAGLNWQIVPSLRVRATAGTSYRAPALFEQFLGDQTGFLGQASVDPCIQWEDSGNENIRANCAADGVPGDYAGTGSSVLVITGGGVDNLEAETSDAVTAGIVWTPGFSNLNVAIDYFEIEVNNQISQLSASSIAAGCYSGENFPNAFCDLLVRAPATDSVRAHNILSVNDSYVNINSQKTSGVDLNLTWTRDFNWGSLDLGAQSTYQIENVIRLFNPDEVSGFDDLDVVGDIGTPQVVSNLRVTGHRNDWSMTYFLQYASSTDQTRTADKEISYNGADSAFQDITMDAWYSHNLSLVYSQDKWDVLFGINNLLDEEPDLVSAGQVGAVSTRGNVPVFATQYSWLGRRIFGRVSYRF